MAEPERVNLSNKLDTRTHLLVEACNHHLGLNERIL